jgi:hypothetical protein
MAMTQAVDGDAKRDSRHIELYHAIQHLNNSVRNLEGLHEKITGPKPKPDRPEAAEVERAPTLSEMLVRGPNWINKLADEIHDLTGAIHEVLF